MTEYDVYAHKKNKNNRKSQRIAFGGYYHKNMFLLAK